MIPKRRNLIYLKRCVRLFLLPCDTSHNQSCQLQSMYYRSLLVAFTIFSCRFLVVHISPTRIQELNRHHQQSPMRVYRTGCCPVPRRDHLRHCCTFGTMLVDQSLFSILAVTPSPRWRRLWFDFEGATELSTVRILRESPCGGLSALVRFGGKVYWQVD
jgi:hypothetical protein